MPIINLFYEAPGWHEPSPHWTYTNLSQNIIDSIIQAFEDSRWYTYEFISYLYGYTLADELDSQYSLSEYTYDAIIYNNDIFYWLEITDWWDMTDITVTWENAWSSAICIISNDGFGNPQYIEWTNVWEDQFSFNVSSYKSFYTNDDTVLIFIASF